MSFTKEEIERLEEIYRKLELTYKSSSNQKIKSQVKDDMDKLAEILENIKNGKWVNPAKLKLFSNNLNRARKYEEEDKKQDISDNYDNVQIKKISSNSNDTEIDELYSYFDFFDKNFYSILTQQNLKLRYEAAKKRDDLLVLYDLLLREVSKYKEDIDNLSLITNENQKKIILDRITTEKFHIIGAFNDFFTKLYDLVSSINSSYKINDKLILNPDEIFINKENMADFNIFENRKIIEVLFELEKFLKIFLSKIKIPSFLKKNKK